MQIKYKIEPLGIYIHGETFQLIITSGRLKSNIYIVYNAITKEYAYFNYNYTFKTKLFKNLDMKIASNVRRKKMFSMILWLHNQTILPSAIEYYANKI
jgi:hypothetical protein